MKKILILVLPLLISIQGYSQCDSLKLISAYEADLGYDGNYCPNVYKLADALPGDTIRLTVNNPSNMYVNYVLYDYYDPTVIYEIKWNQQSNSEITFTVIASKSIGYRIESQNPNGGCTWNVGILINVKCIPAKATLTKPDSTTILNTNTGSTATFKYETESPKDFYIWEYSGDVNVDYKIMSGGGNFDNSVSLAWLTTGTKQVKVSYLDGCGGFNLTSDSAITKVIMPACQSGVDDKYEQNGNQKSATSINLSDKISANIKDSKDQDWYKFTTGGLGLYTVEFIPSGGTAATPELSTSNGTKLSAFSTTEKYTQTFNLTKKTVYFIKINDPKLKGTACYSLKVYAGAAIAVVPGLAQKINSAVSMEDRKGETLVKIYPNPVLGTVHINLIGFSGRTNIQLMDVQGRIVKSHISTIADGTKNDLLIPVQDLENGIYLLRINDSQMHHHTERIIVRH